MMWWWITNNRSFTVLFEKHVSFICSFLYFLATCHHTFSGLHSVYVHKSTKHCKLLAKHNRFTTIALPLFFDKHEGLKSMAGTYFTILSWHIKISCQIDPQLLLLLKQYEARLSTAPLSGWRNRSLKLTCHSLKNQ